MRQRIVRVRCTEEERAAIYDRAAAGGVTVSEYLRRAALGRRVLSTVDSQAVGELRHVAAMLKHLYPKQANWTAEEKRRYWAGYQRLMAIAATIADKADARREDPQ